jgi:hypothetical protein
MGVRGVRWVRQAFGSSWPFGFRLPADILQLTRGAFVLRPCFDLYFRFDSGVWELLWFFCGLGAGFMGLCGFV